MWRCCAKSAGISPINRMLTFDSVKLRLGREQPLTFLEFNYMILQAYDFRELATPRRLPAAARRVGPVGEHRQRHRTRRAAWTGSELYGLTTPLHHHGGRREDGEDRGMARCG